MELDAGLEPQTEPIRPGIRKSLCAGIGIKKMISIFKKLINTLKNPKPSMQFFLDAYQSFF